ncbi:MAG: helix-hairpin-helix domain-containing protein, partial [candidate division WOR-3 bacterium]
FLILFSTALIDLNRASFAEIKKLPIDSTIAYNIYLWRCLYGEFQSVYELNRVDGVTPEIFGVIKPRVKIVPRQKTRSEWAFVLAEQRKLATEEPPSRSAVNEWEDLIISSLNINRASFNELMVIDQMSPQAAQAIIRHRNLHPIESNRDLAYGVKGLGRYKYSILRRYITYTDTVESEPFHFSLRQTVETKNRIDVGDESENQATMLAYLKNAISDFDSIEAGLKSQGLTEQECTYLRDNIINNYNQLSGRFPQPEFTSRLRASYKNRLRLGGYVQNSMIGQPGDRLIKGYAGLANIGPLYRFYLGNYNLLIGQGLLIDNEDTYRARIHTKTQGLFGDLTENYNYQLLGAASHWNLLYFEPILFYSNREKGGILNPDGSILTYWPMREIPALDRFNEEIYGGVFYLNPPVDFLTGSRVGIEGMLLRYDRVFDLNPKWFDRPIDDTQYSLYPEISQSFNTQEKRYLGLDLRTIISNISLEGEAVRQFDQDGFAYLLKTRLEYDWLYLILLFRHYDTAYDNPYGRGFYEQLRFDDTPFERPYTLINPIYYFITDDPRPKPEEGFYLETRYQILRQLTLTRAYVDCYKNLAWGLSNLRTQVELEYRPVFPVRIRVARKLIRKYSPKGVTSSLSSTDESALRFFFYFTDYNSLQAEIRDGKVRFQSTGAGSDLTINGGFLSFSLVHNFNPAFNIESGLAIWETEGMSQWIFEDVGIDFLNSRGMKYYIAVNERVSKNLFFKLKFRHKITDIPHMGIYEPEQKIYYPDLPGVKVNDFIDREDLIGVRLQLDFIF